MPLIKAETSSWIRNALSVSKWRDLPTIQGREEIASDLVRSVCLLKTRVHEESPRSRDVGKSLVEFEVVELPEDVEELLVEELSHVWVWHLVLRRWGKGLAIGCFCLQGEKGERGFKDVLSSLVLGVAVGDRVTGGRGWGAGEGGTNGDWALVVVSSIGGGLLIAHCRFRCTLALVVGGQGDAKG